MSTPPDLSPRERDRTIRRLSLINRGGAIAATAAVVGISAVAAISYPGASAAAPDGGNDGGQGITNPEPAATPTPARTRSGAVNPNPTAQAAPTPAPTFAAPTAPPRSTRGRGRVSSGGS